MKWLSSGGRAVGLYTLVKPDVTGSITGTCHKFKIVRIIIPIIIIKQRNGTKNRTIIVGMYFLNPRCLRRSFESCDLSVTL